MKKNNSKKHKQSTPDSKPVVNYFHSPHYYTKKFKINKYWAMYESSDEGDMKEITSSDSSGDYCDAYPSDLYLKITNFGFGDKATFEFGGESPKKIPDNMKDLGYPEDNEDNEGICGCKVC